MPRTARSLGREPTRRATASVGVVAHVLVAVGDHRAATVPPTLADDVHLGGEERVRGAHDRADVEVVLPVLDGDVEGVPAGVEVGDDRLEAPVAVAVDDVAPVTVARAARGPSGPRSGHGPSHGPMPDLWFHARSGLRRPAKGLRRVYGWRTAQLPARRFRRSRAGPRQVPCDPCTHSPPPYRPSSRPSARSGWTPPTCSSSTAARSSRSPSSSSSSSAACSSRSCPVTRCSSPSASSSRRAVRPLTLNLGVAIAGLTVAAFLGNVVGYEIGRGDRTTSLQTAGPVHQHRQLRQDEHLLRQVRQPRTRARPFRAHRPHVHHRRGRGGRMHRHRFFRWSAVGAVALGRQRHTPRLLPRRGVPGPRLEHRQAGPGDPGLLAHPDRVRVVAPPSATNAAD